MTSTVAPIATSTARKSGVSLRERAQNIVPKLVLAPSFVLVLIFVYGFNLWTLFLSFTNSKAFASTHLVGLANYQKLWTWTFETDPPSSWYTALVNMGIFGGLYVVFCLFLGLTLAILLDQKIRGEGILRPIYLYPLALSFIVTGTAWKLFLDPGIGLEKAVHDWGWTSFKFDWVVNPRMMIYCVAIAGIWQTSGFVMAMFLAGLRGVDGEIIKAAQIDGASAFATYRRIIIPIMRPVFLSALIILTHMAIKSYDLVLSVTGKNPGGAAELPSTFMYSYTFTRNQMAVGSTSAVIMLMTIAAIMVPYLYSELREKGPMSAADLITAPPRREPARHSSITRVVIYGLLALFAFIYLVPLVVMVMTSLKPLDEVTGGNMFAPPHTLTFDPWVQAWGEARIGVSDTAGIKGYFWNSIKMVVPAVLISTLLGALNGYVLTKWRFPGHKLIFGMMLFACFIPFQSVIIPMAVILGYLGAFGNQLEDLVGFNFGFGSPTENLVIVHVVYGLGFTTLFFRNYYEAFPTELVKAAQIDGAGFFQIFRRILLPNSTPIFIVTVIYQFTNIWNDFLFGSTFAAGDQSPMTVALNNLVNTSTGIVEYNVNMAAAIIAAAPTLLVYIVGGRYFVRGLMAGAVKG